MHALLWVAVLSMSGGALPPTPRSGAGDGAQPATIRVDLPADAKLTIDGHATKSTSAVRHFVTPPLEKGTKCHLTFKAEFVRGNQTLTVAQDVSLWAGQETVVSLYGPGPSGIATRAGVTETRSYYFAPESAASSPTGPRYYYFPPSGFGPQSVMESNPDHSQRRSWDFPAPKPMSEFSPMKGFGPPGFDYGYNP